MKGIYLLIRTEQLSSCQTRASLANVQVHSAQKHGNSPSPGTDYELVNNLNNEEFLIYSVGALHHFLLIKSWHNILAEMLTYETSWNTEYICMVNIFTFCLSCWFCFLQFMFCTVLGESCFHCRTLSWAFLSSCEAQSRRNSTGLSTCTTSIKMDISLKRYVHVNSCNAEMSWDSYQNAQISTFYIKQISKHKFFNKGSVHPKLGKTCLC